jgi:alcohol dehydrogenase class IV
VPHGLACAVLLRPVMRFNRESCPEKYARLDGVLGGNADAFVENLMRQMDLPFDLKAFGIKPADIPAIVEESLPSGSLKANPRPVTAESCAEILRSVI